MVKEYFLVVVWKITGGSWLTGFQSLMVVKGEFFLPGNINAVIFMWLTGGFSYKQSAI